MDSWNLPAQHRDNNVKTNYMTVCTGTYMYKPSMNRYIEIHTSNIILPWVARAILDGLAWQQVRDSESPTHRGRSSYDLPVLQIPQRTGRVVLSQSLQVLDDC